MRLRIPRAGPHRVPLHGSMVRVGGMHSTHPGFAHGCAAFQGFPAPLPSVNDTTVTLIAGVPRVLLCIRAYRSTRTHRGTNSEICTAGGPIPT